MTRWLLGLVLAAGCAHPAIAPPLPTPIDTAISATISADTARAQHAAPLPSISADTARALRAAPLPTISTDTAQAQHAAPLPTISADTARALRAAPLHRHTASPGSIRLIFTGDINLGTTLLPDGVPPDSGRGLLAGVDSLLRGDLVIGNFEGVLSDTLPPAKCGPREKSCYTFRTPPYLAARLKEAGFTDLNLANNHAIDLGLAGRDETIRHLDSLGLRHYGPLGSIRFDTLLVGDSARVVALVGFTTYPIAYDLLDIEASRAVVDSVRKLADLVVVTFHGGTEGEKAIRLGKGMEHLGRERRGDLRRWAHAMIEAGADLIVGHGPHVLRGIEFWRRKPIVYSLGNFLTYRGFSLAGYKGITAILELDLDAQGHFLGGRVVPLRQTPRLGPRADRTHAAFRLIRRVTALDFPATGATIGPDGEIGLPIAVSRPIHRVDRHRRPSR